MENFFFEGLNPFLQLQTCILWKFGDIFISSTIFSFLLVNKIFNFHLYKRNKIAFKLYLYNIFCLCFSNLNELIQISCYFANCSDNQFPLYIWLKYVLIDNFYLRYSYFWGQDQWQTIRKLSWVVGDVNFKWR